MSFSKKLIISTCGTQVISPNELSEHISPQQIKAVTERLPSNVEDVEQALLYNSEVEAFADQQKRQFKVAMQELRGIQAEQQNQQERLIKPEFKPVKPLKSLGAAVSAALIGLKRKEPKVEDEPVSADYLKLLRDREIAVQKKLTELREPVPFIHPFWYARTAVQQLELDSSLPSNAVDLLKTVYAAKVFLPKNKRARTTTWYFGISHSGLFMAVSNWYDFRIYESKYCLGKAINYWKGGEELHEDDIERIHNPSEDINDDLIIKVLTDESQSMPLFTLTQGETQEQRRITFYGSALGFLWSERVEGNVNSFNKSRYQICKTPPLFFASVSRYLSERKMYDFQSELDERTYTALCKRINVSNAC